MLKSYFTTAIRNLFRNKIYSLINIVGLSLGLAAAMLIILYVKDETSFDRFHLNVNHIYRVVVKEVSPDGSMKNQSGSTGPLQGPRFTAGVPAIKSFARMLDTYRDIKIGTDVQSQEIFSVDSNFLTMFSFPVISGNANTALLQPRSVVLSEDEAKKRFGRTDPLNKILMVKENDKFVPYTVSAVTRNCPQNSSIRFNMLVPIQISKEDAANNENWFNLYLNTFIVLQPGSTVQSAETMMKKVYESDAKETIRMMEEKYDFKNRRSYLLQPFTNMHLSKEYTADDGLSGSSNPIYSYILSGIALFILVIACINFINLTIARSVKRAKEIGIRKIVGGERHQLILQFMGESFVICFIAFVLGVALVQLTLPVFNQLSNKMLALSYLIDGKMIAGYIGLFLVTGLLSGFYPAIILSNYNPVDTLYSRFKFVGKNYLQRSLIVLQFALAAFLIICTLIVYKQFNYLTTEKLGYDETNLITIHKSGLKEREFQLFRNELLKSNSILGVAPRNGGSWGTSAKVNGDSIVNFDYEVSNESYIPLLKIPLIQGRNFSPDFPSDSAQSVIVNEAFVKEAGWTHPIGQKVNFWYSNKKFTVIGVVKDYHFESLNSKIRPELFSAGIHDQLGMILIKIKPNSETSSLEEIQQVFRRMFPYVPFTYSFKEQENYKSYAAEEKWKQIMLFSAILNIFISAIGLFGLSVLSAEKRTKEIGIRKVLGASVASVVKLLSMEFLTLVMIALLISIPLAWIIAAKWLDNYPYRISLNWIVFAGASTLVILIALVTVSFHAVKAALMNPVTSLKME